MNIDWTFDRTGASMLRGREPFRLALGLPWIRLDGVERRPRDVDVSHDGESTEVCYTFVDGHRLELVYRRISDSAYRVDATVVTTRSCILNRMVLFSTAGETAPCFGDDVSSVRILTESGYSSDVRDLDELTPTAPEHDGEGSSAVGATEPNTELEDASVESGVEPWVSRGHWLCFDRSNRNGLLIGFITAERWEGTITLSPFMQESAEDGRIELEVGFDGCDTQLSADSRVSLETCVVSLGEDPHALLDDYARAAVSDVHIDRIDPPVSWCSWYPYRRGVTEERILANARIAADRLRAYGMSIIEADLGWEKDYLPSSFEENDQFPHGLKWLAERIESMGMSLGVWKAPYTVSEFDPVASEHPEMLICDGDGKPVGYWTWFWEPHGDVYIVDLTTELGQRYLRDRIGSLYDRGVRYFKPDFISCARNPIAKNRSDRSIVAGPGTEMARIGAKVISDSLHGAPVLNCGGPDIPGTGSLPLIYACNDTGNTGHISWDFMESNYRTLACHLFKNRIWGVLQPSCLCVGMPGTIEESRLRATIAFLTAGQIDISDDLTTLPEDRWEIITATLPTAPRSATPIDLFEPLFRVHTPGYTASASSGTDEVPPEPRGELPAGTVWHLHLDAGWDSWDLVAVFNYATHENPNMIAHIPLSRLGLDPTADIVGYEFWSRLFLGNLGSPRGNPAGTDHPGDAQDMAKITGEELRVEFFGPAVKLLAIRARKQHPWVVGTSFHQSCGLDLNDVRWNENTLTVSIDRPTGATGELVIDPAGREIERIVIDHDRGLPWKYGANGSAHIPVVVSSSTESIEIVFKESV